MKKNEFLLFLLLVLGTFLSADYHLEWITAVPDTIYDDDSYTYSEIEACIYDENDYPVSGERVDFDCNLGSCLPYDLTNSQGIAETSFWEGSDEPGTATIIISVDNTILGEIQVEILPVVSAEDDIPVIIAANSFPNPFRIGSDRNSGTTISFSINSQKDDSIIDKVDVSVFSIKGDLVRDFDLDIIPTQALYNVWWDGKNNSGKTVNSGIYLYTVSTKEFIAKGKMTLIK